MRLRRLWDTRAGAAPITLLVGLTQDLSKVGGPGAITTRKIEQGEARALRGMTKAGFEHALGWPAGHVDRILEGFSLARSKAAHPSFTATTGLTATATTAPGSDRELVDLVAPLIARLAKDPHRTPAAQRMLQAAILYMQELADRHDDDQDA